MTIHRILSTWAGTVLAASFAAVLTLAAQQPAPEVPVPPTPPPSVGDAAPPDESQANPAVRPEEAEEDTSGLRRLDTVEQAESAGEARSAPESGPDSSASSTPASRQHHRHQRQMVQFFTDVVLSVDERAEELVAIFGNVIAEGVAHGSAVAIFGSTTVSGSAHEAVAVMGSVTVSGRVNEAAVAVMGDTTVSGEADVAVAVLGSVWVEGKINGDLVAVLGNVRLGPDAVVDGEVVSIGGRIDRAPGSVVTGGTQQIGPFPMVVEGMEGLRTWFRICFALGRPLAFDVRVLWAWGIAAAFLGFYLFLALLFNRSIIACAETLERRPGMTVVAALVTALLAPLLTILLSFIGVGLLLIPLLLLASLYGKATFLAWLGRRITLPIGWSHSLPAVLFGGLILMLLYAIPFVGFLVLKGTSILGLGMVVYTVLLAGRKERPLPPAPGAAAIPVAPAPTPAPAASLSAPVGAGATAGVGAVAATLGEQAAAGGTVAPQWTPPVPPSTLPPPLTPPSPTAATAGAPTFAPVPPAVPLSYATLPRAGFWLRLGASLLDFILVGIVLGMAQLGDYLPVLFATYCVVLWALRATTIGGIICGLKVVRLDERKIDWPIAVVRALGGFLSLAVAGLGFIWVAFDSERQSWHDKIAGTTIVRVPKGVTLV